MIKIKIGQKPLDFDEKVKEPGESYLEDVPHPTGQQWSNHNYWTRCSEELYDSQNGVCCYTGCLIPSGVGTPTADHQIPKIRRPRLAYEWDNLRLAALLPNSNKRDKYVLDASKIEDDWFYIDFSSLTVIANSNKSERIIKNVRHTINELKLNNIKYKLMRAQNLSPFIHRKWQLDYLEIASPFMSKELKRQGLTDPDDLKKIIVLPLPPVKFLNF